MTMIILIFVVLGLYSYRMLGVDLYPDINMPYVSVSVGYPGAGAEEVETQIVKPLESTLASLSKVKRTYSQASEGFGFVVIEFEMTANADQAALDVQKKVDAAKGRLPEDASDPVVMKADMNAMPVMALAVTSPRPLHETYQLADDIIKDRLQKLDGVTDVALSGGQDRLITVHVDKLKLEGYGLSINTITNRLSNENLNQPSGRLDQPEAEYNVRVLGEFKTVQEIESLQIPLGNGQNIPLREIARVEDGFEEVREYSRLNGEPSIGLLLFKQSDASVVEVGDTIKNALPAIQQELPPDFQVTITRDFSQFVHDALSGTRMNILEGILTTALALFFFLREWRSMMTVLIAIPVSLIATLMGMYFAGFSFNLLSLMGMALCIGILVDDSIVVIENIHRHRSMGKGAVQAAIEGRSEVGMAAIAITLSDVVVFTPIAFMGGMIGQFFRQFGLTVVIATLFSLFVSFTLTPMLSARFYMEEDAATRELKARARSVSVWGWLLARLRPLGARFWPRIDAFGLWVVAEYDYMLRWSLQNRKKVLALALAGFLASLTLVYPFGLVGAEFMPSMDQGQVSLALELPIGTPIEKTDEALKQIEAFLVTIPEIKHFQSSVGTSGGRAAISAGSNKGQIGIQLYPKEDRKRTMWEVGDQLREFGKTFPLGIITVSESENTGGPSGSAIQVEVSGPDYEVLLPLAEQAKQIIEATPGAKDVDMNFRMGQPEVQVRINREKAAAYGLAVNDIARTLRASLSGDTATIYRSGDTEIDVEVKIENLNKTDLSTLQHLTLTTANGTPVALNQVAEISKGSGPTEIRRVNRQRTITVSGNLDQAKAQATFSQDLSQKLTGLQLPPGYGIKLAGQDESMRETFRELFYAFGLSILLVYMVLAILYESVITPLIRMFSLPLGIIGALCALAITGNTLNLFSMIGVIMMDGLVAKNGTLLIDYTNTLRERGFALRDALMEAARVRLRPIMMTSITMVFGMLPTAMALTAGTEMRSGMAVVLIGGLITSTLFTLLVIPVFYTLIDDWGQRRKARKLARLQQAAARALASDQSAGQPAELLD